ncbi:hypothetical protein CIRG_05234 [Coccidioides immitis RMSCC 2394]|uniref:Uncharacterized protein n=1 Tax=Coccidioides immitis RMSCC 2394 TaxID=404692 RepID=A0A0J6YF38_COCIT|nr:hypothetical protein CIRG_05234 [Coccidioides immitis RMSCC 2394]
MNNIGTAKSFLSLDLCDGSEVLLSTTYDHWYEETLSHVVSSGQQFQPKFVILSTNASVLGAMTIFLADKIPYLKCLAAAPAETRIRIFQDFWNHKIAAVKQLADYVVSE